MVNIARRLFGFDKPEPKPEPEMSEELRYNIEMSQKRINSLESEEE